MRNSSKIRGGSQGLRLTLGASVLVVAGLLGSVPAQAQTLTTIDYFTDTGSSEVINELQRMCTEKTGIATERQSVPYPELVQRVLLSATSGALPDLIMMDNSDVAQLAEGGLIVPLAEVGVSTEGFTQALIDIGNYKGKNYSVQAAANTLGLWYNKDILGAAGVTPPTTWAELREAAKTLTTADTYGFVFPAVATEEGTFHTSPFIWSNGGNFEVLNSPENIEALTFLADMVKDGSISPSVVTWNGNDANDQFLAGRAAMSIGGAWHIPRNSAAEGFNYGIVSIPVPEAGDALGVPVGGEVWAVSSTADKANAKAFLDCLLSDDMVMFWGKARNNVPGKPNLTEQYGIEVPSMAPFISSVAGARSRTSVLGIDYPKYSSAYSAAMQAVLTGSKDAKTALDEAQAQVGM